MEALGEEGEVELESWRCCLLLAITLCSRISETIANLNESKAEGASRKYHHHYHITIRVVSTVSSLISSPTSAVSGTSTLASTFFRENP